MCSLKKSKSFISWTKAFLFVLVWVVGLVLYTQQLSIAQELRDVDRVRAEIEEINATIQRQGARWIAGETSFSRLPLAEKRKLLGSIKPTMMGEEESFSSYQPQSAPPPNLDWRNNGGNFVPLLGTRAVAEAVGPSRQRRPLNRLRLFMTIHPVSI